MHRSSSPLACLPACLPSFHAVNQTWAESLFHTWSNARCSCWSDEEEETVDDGEMADRNTLPKAGKITSAAAAALAAPSSGRDDDCGGECDASIKSKTCGRESYRID